MRTEKGHKLFVLMFPCFHRFVMTLIGSQGLVEKLGQIITYVSPCIMICDTTTCLYSCLWTKIWILYVVCRNWTPVILLVRALSNYFQKNGDSTSKDSVGFGSLTDSCLSVFNIITKHNFSIIEECIRIHVYSEVL